MVLLRQNVERFSLAWSILQSKYYSSKISTSKILVLSLTRTEGVPLGTPNIVLRTLFWNAFRSDEPGCLHILAPERLRIHLRNHLSQTPKNRQFSVFLLLSPLFPTICVFFFFMYQRQKEIKRATKSSSMYSCGVTWIHCCQYS